MAGAFGFVDGVLRFVAQVPSLCDREVTPTLPSRSSLAPPTALSAPRQRSPARHSGAQDFGSLRPGTATARKMIAQPHTQMIAQPHTRDATSIAKECSRPSVSWDSRVDEYGDRRRGGRLAGEDAGRHHQCHGPRREDLPCRASVTRADSHRRDGRTGPSRDHKRRDGAPEAPKDDRALHRNAPLSSQRGRQDYSQPTGNSRTSNGGGPRRHRSN